MKPYALAVRLIAAVAFCLSVAQVHAMTVFLVGDSTVADFAPPDPRQGWGQVIGRYFAKDVTVSNHALSGRSSRSFFAEGAWAPVLGEIKPGDYVIIQFGHNDEKRDAERGTEPYGSYQEYLSRYVDDTIKAGGFPILVTPVARGSFRRNFSHGNYPDAMFALARQKGVPCIDLNRLSEALYRKLGGSATYALFIASIDGKDNTHFTPAGAEAVARLVAQAIKDLGIPLSGKVADIE